MSALPPGASRGASSLDEAAERIEIGADPWFDRHPLIAIVCVTFVALSLICAAVYGGIQFLEYLRYALETAHG